MWFASLSRRTPPLLERIARIDRRFNPIEYLRRRRPRASEPLETAAPVAPAAQRAPPPAAAAPLAARPAPDARAARVASVLGSVGRVTPSHVQYASAVLGELPAAVNEARRRLRRRQRAGAGARAERRRAGAQAADRAAGGGGGEALARRADALAGRRADCPSRRGCRRRPGGPVAAAARSPARRRLSRQLQMLVEADTGSRWRSRCC